MENNLGIFNLFDNPIEIIFGHCPILCNGNIKVDEGVLQIKLNKQNSKVMKNENKISM